MPSGWTESELRESLGISNASAKPATDVDLRQSLQPCDKPMIPAHRETNAQTLVQVEEYTPGLAPIGKKKALPAHIRAGEISLATSSLTGGMARRVHDLWVKWHAKGQNDQATPNGKAAFGKRVRFALTPPTAALSKIGCTTSTSSATVAKNTHDNIELVVGDSHD